MPDLAAMMDAARAFPARWTGDRARLADLLGDGPAAAAVRDPRGILVVTGQQPAVGGGPLYTLLKAVHAVHLAGRLRAAGVPAAALFWCASDDHDLGEADHADLVRRDARIARFRLPLGQPRALRHIPAAGFWDGFLAWCGEHLGPGLGTDWLRQQAPLPGEGLGAWECRLLAALVPGLHAVEAWRLRPAWSAVLATALERWPRTDLAALRARLIAGGSDPLGPLDHPPLFLDRPDGRRALAPDEARDQLDRDPLSLSPGAALRPILQQVALPAALAVLGPGERAYHAALPPIYASLGVPEPLHVPRLSRTLVPGWVERACLGHALTVEQVLAGSWPPAIPDGILAELDAAIERIGVLHPRRLGSLGRLRRERDRLAAGLARDQLARPGPAQLHDWLRPRGQAQERVMSLLQAVWEHGPGIVAALAEDGDPQPSLVRI